MYLSRELHTRCCKTLSECNEFFEDDASLRAIFVTDELAPYQDGLPTSSNKKERVVKVINYLLTRRLSGGRPVFAIFLATLCDRYSPGDELFDSLTKCQSESEKELCQFEVIDISFVVVAMTGNEAKGLKAESVFQDPAVAPLERQRFQRFRESLEESGIDDWVSHYGDRREDWKPYVFPYDEQKPKTIERVIDDMAFRINQGRKNSNLPLINPLPYSKDFFSKESSLRAQAWDHLKQSGGILILDAISLFHPQLHQVLLQSAISSSRNVAMLVLSPVSFGRIHANELIEKRISSQVQRVFDRFHIDLDTLCEVGTGDLRFLQRWLFAVLPQVESFVQGETPNSVKLGAFRTMTKDTMPEGPPKVDQLIFGKRGAR